MRKWGGKQGIKRQLLGVVRTGRRGDGLGTAIVRGFLRSFHFLVYFFLFSFVPLSADETFNVLARLLPITPHIYDVAPPHLWCHPKGSEINLYLPPLHAANAFRVAMRNSCDWPTLSRSPHAFLLIYFFVFSDRDT